MSYSAGMVLESKDQSYEPGRRIRLEALEPGHTSARWLVITVANPRRPHLVGSGSLISERTLRAKWFQVTP